VRGTGTSGYVQTNKFNLRGGPDRRETERRGHGKEGSQKGHVVKPNKDIIDHNRKRELEVKVMEYRIQLEDDECVCVVDVLYYDGCMCHDDDVGVCVGFLRMKLNQK
jgi:serine/arginine repetitive matrix protein 2